MTLQLMERALVETILMEVIFEAVRGLTEYGDTALDNVRVRDGSCGDVTPTPDTTTIKPSTGHPTPPPVPDSGTCVVEGDPHYHTFDKQLHHFMGTCTYTLSKLCKSNSSLPYFNVEAANEHRGSNTRVSYVQYVDIDVYGYRINLGKTRVVKVDGVSQVLPLTLAQGVSISFSGQYVVVATDFGLTVKFDGNHRAEITLPSTYMSKVCGICGNYNGHKADDFLNPDGEMETNSASLGNSWQVYNDSRCLPDDGHTPNCTVDEKHVIQSNEYCGLITDPSGPFQNCHSVVDPQSYSEACQYDLCELHLNNAALCQNLQAYADVCQAAGVQLTPWRNATFCPPYNCSLPCVEGCVCNSGYLLYNDRCVPSQQCGCWHNGQHYPVGSEFWTDNTCSSKCTCPARGSKVQCASASCPAGQYCGLQDGKPECLEQSYGICHVHGDPHYNTFDKVTHHFMGTCTYTLAKVCSNTTSLPYFNVEAKNEHRGNSRVSYVREVLVEVYGERIVIVKKEKSQVLVNNLRQTLPVSAAGGAITVSRSGRYIVLETDFNLRVSYDADHSVEVKVPTTYFNLTCGMCGNFNNRREDDYMMPNGQQAADSNELGESWQVPDKDSSCGVPVPPQPCSAEEEKLYRSDRFCGMLTARPGSFERCHAVINPQSYFETCFYDLCALNGGQEVLCAALEAYADACQAAGVTLLPWRNATFCPVACPPNSHYNPCTSACPATCIDPLASKNCSRPCVEGCECNNGFVISGGQCVSMSNCGCLQNGKYYEVNGVEVYLPVDLNHGARVAIKGNYVVIDTSLGIQVKFDGDQELFILVDESLKGQLCGLCGTFNDNQLDDFLKPDKVLEQDPNKFGDSWLVKDDNRMSIDTKTHRPLARHYNTASTHAVNTKTHTDLRSTSFFTLDSVARHYNAVATPTSNTTTWDDLRSPLILSLGKSSGPVMGLMFFVQGTCVVEGDPHYHTFDKQLHHFMGTCTYTLSKLCKSNSSLPYFNVEAANEHRGSNTRVSYVRYVDVDVAGQRIRLGKGGAVTVNGVAEFLPCTPSVGVQVSSSGFHTVVTTDFGLRVKFDGKHRVEVTLPSTFGQKVCGMCGNYNGMAADDFLNPEGVMEPDSTSLGNSWQVSNDSSCAAGPLPTPACNETDKQVIASSHFCGLLTDTSGPFQMCHAVVSPSGYFNTCLYDLCELGLDREALCKSLQSYADACQSLGVKIPVWRNATFCPITCPANSHYEPCAAACPATCVDPMAPATCSLPCVEGCVCDSGYLLYNDRCVPSQQCGCWHNGQHYPVGSEFWTDNTCSSKCTCPARGSKVQCASASCPAGQYCGLQDGKPECLEQSYGICHVHGDPHYNTFDKVTHHFMGTCTYTLAKVCSNTTSLPYFNVEAKNEHRGNSRVSYVREVLVEVYGERIVIVKKEKSQVLVGSGAGTSVARLQGRAGFSWQGLACTRHLHCPRPGWVPLKPLGCFVFPFRRGWRRKRQMGNGARVEERPLQSAEHRHGSASHKGRLGVRASWAPVCRARPVNNLRQTLPVSAAGGAITVSRSGRYIVLETDFNLRVSYDADHSVEVKVPTTYFNLTCGMCGNFNNRREDDYMMPNGQQAADSNELGESWQVPDKDSSCGVPVPPQPCSAEEEKLYRSDRFCGMLTARPGSFERCHAVINPQSYFETCFYDLCALNGGQEVLCAALEAYADACQAAGVTLLPWRNATFCPLLCPANSYYDPCMTGCPATCVDRQAPQNCSKPCMEGCACTSGFLLSGDTCVPEAHCGCLFEGTYYSEDEYSVNENCTRQCQCEANGQMVCSPLSCGEDEVCKIQNGQRGCYPASTALCHIYGDPHYSTFDGKLHHFQGSCNYTVVTGCDNSSVGFSVTTRNEHRSSQSWTALNSVALSVEGLHIALRKNKAVYVSPSFLHVGTTDARGTIKYHSVPKKSLIFPEPAGMLTEEHGEALSGADMAAHAATDFRPVFLSFRCAVGRVATVLVGLGRVSHAISASDSLGPGAIAVKNSDLSVEGISLCFCLPLSPLFRSTVLWPPCLLLLPLLGLQLQFNGDHELLVKVSEKHKGKLCGLCGTYTGSQQDDFMRPDGVVVPDLNQFGNSWMVPDEEWTCNPDNSPPASCSPSEEEAANKQCAILTQPGGPFQPCHAVLPPETYFESCVYDQCATGGSTEQLCNDLGAYAAACAEAGVALGDWSDGTVCGPSTPKPTVPLPGTTTQPPRTPSTPRPTPTSGTAMFHSPLLLLVETVHFTSSKAHDHGPLPSSPSTPLPDTTTQSPHPPATPPPGTTSGTCVVEGDPHYHTFDKQLHHFMGTCTYTLSKLCKSNSSLPYFNVEAANEHRGSNTRVSYVRYVDVDVAGQRIRLGKGGAVTVNGVAEFLPCTPSVGVQVSSSGFHTVVTTDFGLRVKFDGKHRVEVTLPSTFGQKVCGMCGNYNGMAADDFLNPEGVMEPDSTSLGNSWQVSNDSSCAAGPLPTPACNETDKQVIASSHFCGLLTDTSGPFQMCHAVVSPSGYFNTCLYDLCELGLDREALCKSLQSYADACQSLGVKIPVWRNATFCPITCPANSHYEPCAAACPATCVDPMAPATCSLPCVEGCVCDSGYLLYNDRCVPSQQCGCWHNGQHYPVGSEFWTDNTCSSKCTCPARGSKVQCASASCPAGQYCGLQDGKPECLEQSYGICHVHGDPHYNTFDKVTHHFMGTCTYTLAKVCSNTTSLPYFNVEAKNEHRGNSRVSYVREVLVEVYGERIVIVKKEKSQVLVGSGAGTSVARLQGRAGFSWQGLACTRHLHCPRPGWVPLKPLGCFVFPFRRGWRRKRQMGNGARVEERPLQSAEHRHGSASHKGRLGVRASWAPVCRARPVNNLRQTLPVSAAGGAITVSRSGRYIVLETDFNLRVSYDADHSVEVKVPTTYFNLTCGMCGNFNNRREDDYMMPNGQQAADSNELGESWQVPDKDSSCGVPVPPQPCSAEEEKLYRSDRFCGMLTARPGSFERCHAVINPQSYFETCFYDLCALNGGQEVLCAALEAYADACQAAGVTLLPWRNATFCPLLCPANSYYDPCMTGCPATCVDRQAPQNCSKPCMEGCACTSGFLLSGDTCVPEAHCGCLFEGTYYSEDEYSVNENCTRQCQCEANGQMVCSPLSCGEDEVCKIQNGQRGCYPASTALCHIYGDPHYSTFDGKLHHFQGSCNYTVVTGCDNSSVGFSVTTRNEHRSSQSWTALNSVALSVEGLHIALRKNKAVYINGALASLPASPAPGVTISLSGSYVRVSTKLGLQLQFNGDHELLVKVSEKHKGKLCGLCGTYTGSQQDDFMRPDGVVVPDLNQFGNSWMVPDEEWTCNPDNSPPASCSPSEEEAANKQCAILTQPGGPFQPCHAVLPPETYFESCVYDQCATGGSTEQLCNDLGAYAAACAEAGVALGDWSDGTVCGKCFVDLLCGPDSRNGAAVLAVSPCVT
ncbi:IgGFc-binding protein-like [Theristicus caerulescens]